jgi:predicted hydrolase (HD superfamily)
MTRAEAWSVVCEFVKSESLRRHMLGVEACLSAYAQTMPKNSAKTPNSGK